MADAAIPNAGEENHNPLQRDRAFAERGGTRRLPTRILDHLNRGLGTFRLELALLNRDLDDHLVDDESLDRMFVSLAKRITSFLKKHCIFDVKRPAFAGREIRAFYEAYMMSPYRLSRGGSRFPNLLWLHILQRATAADHAIDSGTFAGGSAWALALGEEGASVDSFDLTLARLRAREAKVRYHERDWTSVALSAPSSNRTLCYFDDHVDQLRRIREAYGRGYEYLIFDDDFSATGIAGRVKGSFALPKAAFMFDDGLLDGQEIVWFNGRRENRYRIDRAYLDETRGLVAAYQRLPSLAEISGVDHQPYSLVRLRGSGTAGCARGMEQASAAP